MVNSRLLATVDDWLTVSRPVSYWSLWTALLRTAPILVAVVGIAGYATGGRGVMLSIAPIPFIFTAATLGYAVRELDASGVLTSLGLAAAYAGVLAVTGTAWTVLQRPTLTLSLLGVLTFAAVVSGFAAPTLHGPEDTGAETERQAYVRHRRDR